MQKIIQNWESLQGNKTNTFVTSSYVYFVCTTGISYYMRPYLYGSIRSKWITVSTKNADAFLSFGNIRRQ
jgi:hypothetical protein